eukprot:1468973-Rhodomonas_salina.1
MASKVAATEEPILKFKLALGGMSFGSIPGQLSAAESWPCKALVLWCLALTCATCRCARHSVSDSDGACGAFRPGGHAGRRDPLCHPQRPRPAQRHRLQLRR